MTISTFQGGRQAFNALVYAPSDPTLLDRLNSSFNSAISSTAALSDRFVSSMKSIYDMYSSAEAIATSKQLMYEVGHHMHDNVIRPYSYDNLGTANSLMQQYIMVYPDLSKLHKRDMCYGYADTYINPEPGVYGEDTHMYKAVMDGMLLSNVEQDAIKHYSTSHIVGKELDFLDKTSILMTWDAVALSLMNECDPTDPDRGDL